MKSERYYQMLDEAWNEFRRNKAIEYMTEKITSKLEKEKKIATLRKGKLNDNDQDPIQNLES